MYSGREAEPSKTPPCSGHVKLARADKQHSRGGGQAVEAIDCHERKGRDEALREHKTAAVD